MTGQSLGVPKLHQFVLEKLLHSACVSGHAHGCIFTNHIAIHCRSRLVAGKRYAVGTRKHRAVSDGDWAADGSSGFARTRPQLNY